MCGRFVLDRKSEAILQAFDAEADEYSDWTPSYSIAPTDRVPIIRERRHRESGQVSRNVDAAVWDFHPAFMRDAKRPQFNARIEAVATNGLWKAAFASSRCIVPMRGYYEWSELQENGKTVKQPHFIHGEPDLLAAAGIYAVRKVDDDWVVSAAIITREARDAAGRVHDRMPAFLVPGVYDEWLNPATLESDADREHVLSLLDVVSDRVASTITTYEVDRRVNNSRTIDPADASLIDPVEHQGGRTPGRSTGGEAVLGD